VTLITSKLDIFYPVIKLANLVTTKECSKFNFVWIHPLFLFPWVHI